MLHVANTRLRTRALEKRKYCYQEQQNLIIVNSSNVIPDN